MDTPHRHHGFTLIEMSIVLVIIGLIIGGVLVGRDMIKQAELRKLMSEKDKIVSAVHAFHAKYNCLPGDCPNATQLFGVAAGDGTGNDTACYSALDAGGATGTCNGDGNDLIEYCGAFADNCARELALVWQHLSLAGLISGTYSGGLYANVYNNRLIPGV